TGAPDPLHVLAGQLARWRTEPVAGLPPFQGGAAGLFGYDLCHHLERLPRPRHDEFEVPDLAVGFYDWVVAFDHRANHAWLLSTGPRCRRSSCTAGRASATPPRSPATSTSATSSSPAPRRSASCGSRAARSRRGPSRAPGRAAGAPRRTAGTPRSCCARPRTG